MVRLALHSIAYEAKTLNLAKEGYTAFYVDGTNGLDIHDGGSWGQAFKTIQHAVDESESWTTIFIKAGTYDENVVIANDGMLLEGQSRDTVKISPTSGTALTITGENFKAVSITTVSNIFDAYSTILQGRYGRLHNVAFTSTIAGGRGAHIDASNCDLQSIYINDALTRMGVIFAAGINDSEIRDSYLKLTEPTAYAIGFSAAATNIVIHDNTIEGCLYGVSSAGLAKENTIFHNNFISVTVPIHGPDNNYFENYYSGHTTDTNNDGFCDTSFVGAVTDYKPISKRDGWKQESLGISIGGCGDVTQIGNLRMSATTIDLNQAAATYTLLTGTTQAVVLEKLVFRMPNVDISGGSLTSILIQTDDATPAVLISAADGVLANLTQEASLTWTGSLLIPVGTLIRLTIAGGVSGTACSCDVVAESRAVVNLGYLA